MKTKSTVLSNTQLKQLAGRLQGTTTNVNTLAKAMFGLSFRDPEDWLRLETDHDLFRCVECDIWQSVKEERHHGDLCNDCYEEENSDD